MKNRSLDLLKGISCLIVIFLHCRFPGVVGDGIIYGLRFSVPIFFMVSGYYSFGKSGKWIAGHMRKLLKMIVCSELLYGAVLFVVQCVSQGKTVAQFLSGFQVLQHPLKTLFFGVICNGSLWYLYAMFWTWGILWILDKMKWIDRVYWLIPVLLPLHIVGRYYCQNHADIEALVHLFCNSLLFGLPFTLLGRWIAENEGRLREKLSFGKCIVLVILGHLLIVAEFVVSGQYMDLHFSTVVIAFGLFLCAVERPNFSHMKWLSYLGGRYSMWIYLVHFPVIAIVGEIGRLAGVSETAVYGWARSVAVCLCSVAAAAGMDYKNSNNFVRKLAKRKKAV